MRPFGLQRAYDFGYQSVHEALEPDQFGRQRALGYFGRIPGPHRSSRIKLRPITRMTISKPNLVRLLFAVLGAGASAWFVVLYTRFSRFRFEFEHPGGNLTPFNTAMSAYGQWLSLLPLLPLVLGLWLLISRPTAAMCFELVLSATWFVAFALALLCVLSWQIQNVPIY